MLHPETSFNPCGQIRDFSGAGGASRATYLSCPLQHGRGGVGRTQKGRQAGEGRRRGAHGTGEPQTPAVPPVSRGHQPNPPRSPRRPCHATGMRPLCPRPAAGSAALLGDLPARQRHTPPPHAAGRRHPPALTQLPRRARTRSLACWPPPWDARPCRPLCSAQLPDVTAPRTRLSVTGTTRGAAVRFQEQVSASCLAGGLSRLRRCRRPQPPPPPVAIYSLGDETI